MGNESKRNLKDLVDNNTDYRIEPHEEPINVLIVLKDLPTNKFGCGFFEFSNIVTEAFYDRAGGFYSVTSQSYETYIFPMSSISYIRKWSPKEEKDGK